MVLVRCLCNYELAISGYVLIFKWTYTLGCISGPTNEFVNVRAFQSRELLEFLTNFFIDKKDRFESLSPPPTELFVKDYSFRQLQEQF